MPELCTAYAIVMQVRNSISGLPIFIATVIYVMAVTVSYGAIQEAVSLIVHSHPIFIQVKVASGIQEQEEMQG
jgi:hypothetical protein